MLALRAIYLVASGFSLSGAASAGLSGECAMGEFTVVTESDFSRGMTCEAVREALELLGACGLEQRTAVQIDVVPEIDVAGVTECVGSYDCEANRIKVVDASSLKKVVSVANPFSALDSEEYYTSIVVHEVAHAIVEQNTGDRELDLADREYIAYAMQFASLSPASRNLVLDSLPAIDGVTTMELNSFAAAAIPIRFGAKAWIHFNTPESGCHFVRRLTSGETSLSMPPL